MSTNLPTRKLAKPRILLIGAGRFGRNHLRVLKELDQKGDIELVGVMLRHKEHRDAIESEFGVKTYAKLSPALLKSVNAVDVVTPPETHFEIIRKCLKYTNVFAEKPLAETEKDAVKLDRLARANKKMLSVGHIFRYHPVAEKLKELLQGEEMPRKIIGFFINPSDSDQGREPSLELLHLFDVVDFIWKKNPQVISSSRDGRVSIVDIRYGRHHDASFSLGWRGNEKKRNLIFRYEDKQIEADFITNEVTVIKKNSRKSYECPIIDEPLRKEIVAFVHELKTRKKGLVNGSTAVQIVSIAEKAIPKPKRLPSVAIIGGGIFGTSVAAELGKFCSVTLFEKNDDLLKEGSFINQFRHHRGYHYPRSDETVMDIKRSRDDFEKIFNEAIVETSPTYYGLAKHGSLVSDVEFLAFCDKHGLPYKKAFPPAGLLSKEEIALSVEVPEGNYHHERLKRLIKVRLKTFPKIKVLYSVQVTKCSVGKDGTKTMTYRAGKSVKKKKFDFVVNATYANINRFAHWLDFENHPIRIDLAEVLIVKLPIDPISITVIDGPFATLMPTGNPNEFTLYHVRESIIDRYVPGDGLVKALQTRRSNQKAIFDESLKLFPILKDAVIVESRVVHRGVRAYHEHDDSRVADLINHGFGCWSILSGKILSSVSIAKRLASIVLSTVKTK